MHECEKDGESTNVNDRERGRDNVCEGVNASLCVNKSFHLMHNT